MSDPAPPPCESYFPQLGYRFEEFCRTHVRPIHLCFEAKDAEIAELRAQRELLAGQLAIDSEWGCDRWVEWAEKHVAALAPKGKA